MQFNVYQYNSSISKWIFTFPGFGQKSEWYNPLVDHILHEYNVIYFELPQSSYNNAITIQDINITVKKIIEEYNIDNIILVAYSMGAKMSILVHKLFALYIKKNILIAPDGFIKSFWYRFSVSNFFFNGIFSFITKHSFFVKKIIIAACRIGIISRDQKMFFLYNIRNREACKQLYNTWTGMKNICPSMYLPNNEDEKVHIFLGKNDKIIPIKVKNKIVHYMPRAHITIMNTHHFMLQKEVFVAIQKLLIL